jgi:hypothetical protein
MDNAESTMFGGFNCSLSLHNFFYTGFSFYVASGTITICDRYGFNKWSTNMIMANLKKKIIFIGIDDQN